MLWYWQLRLSIWLKCCNVLDHLDNIIVEVMAHLDDIIVEIIANLYDVIVEIIAHLWQSTTLEDTLVGSNRTLFHLYNFTCDCE